MNSAELKTLQARIKSGYKDDPNAALVTMSVTGSLNREDLTCSVPTYAGTAVAGLHPAAGGDGSLSCSGVTTTIRSKRLRLQRSSCS